MVEEDGDEIFTMLTESAIVDLADRRPPVCYTVHLTQHWDGRLQVLVQDVADDERSRLAVAKALRKVADGLENGTLERS